MKITMVDGHNGSVRGVLFGGNTNNGANAGFVNSNSNNAPSNTNANIGSRLSFTQKIFIHEITCPSTLPLGKRQICDQGCW